MSSKLSSAAVVGIDAITVEVEVDIAPGLSAFTIVGLPDTAIQEARERVRSAMKNSDLPFPRQRVTVNLAPADVRKVGPAYDLPIAVGVLSAQGEDHTPMIPPLAEDTIVLGELALDGAVRRIDGVVPVAMAARSLGRTVLIVPKENAAEAALVEDVTVIGVEHLRQVVAYLRKELSIDPHPCGFPEASPAPQGMDLGYIHGQETAKRVLEIVCAGGHNLLMSGPPGGGKTLLAKTLPTLLPPMTRWEQLEVTRIYSIAGLVDPRVPLATTRPFRSPHHTASDIALVGGGTTPRPGEVSLAHRGVLFLDELPEFSRSVIEALRQPIEDGLITVSRAASTIQFPARFMLVAAQNPCPCGYYNDSRHQCTCSVSQVLRYQKKVSGPLMDRIDIAIDVPAVETEKLVNATSGQAMSPLVRERVTRTRIMQQERFKDRGIVTNADMGPKELEVYCAVDAPTRAFLSTAIDRHRLSARGYYRLLKVARTIADLSSCEHIGVPHLAEALQYRLRSVV